MSEQKTEQDAGFLKSVDVVDHVQADNKDVGPAPKPRGVMKATNPWSFIALTYLTDMMKTSVKRPLEPEDVPMLKEEDRADALAKCLEPFNQHVAARLQAEKANPNADPETLPPKISLLRPIFKSYGHVFGLAAFFQLLQVVSGLYIPFVLQALIVYLQNKNLAEGARRTPDVPAVPFQNNGVALSLFLFVVSILNGLCEPTMSQFNRGFQFNVAGIVRTAVFEKALKMSNAASKEFDEGVVLSLVNVDADQLAMTFSQITSLFALPLEIVFTIVFLVRLIGVSIYPSAIILVIAFAITTPISGKFMKFRREYMVTQDKRIKKIREVLLGMRVVKLGATEEIREKEIEHERNSQLKALLASLNYICMLFAASDLPASLMPMASFLVYSQRNGGVIDPAVIFPAMIYFSNLYRPMQMLPSALTGILAGRVSLIRIEKFLYASERDVDFGATPAPSATSTTTATDDAPAIEIRNLTAKWQEAAPADDGKDAKKGKKAKKEEAKKEAKSEDQQDEQPKKEGPLFENLSLSFPKGKMTAVVGVVGSGKSSLLSAMIGEMTVLSGTVSVQGRVALCQQQPWLLSLTVEENILFGQPSPPSNPELFDLALTSTSFVRDLESMEGGINTEIGEKGITLSGGQKARLALARAVYDDADCYLLDDPLAALDAQVGKEVFENCFVKALEGKTRVLVTHQLHVVPKVDRIIVLKDGKVAEEGTYEELMAIEDGVLKNMMKDYKTDEASSETESDTVDGDVKGVIVEGAGSAEKNEKKDYNGKAGKGGLIAIEDRERGALKMSVLVEYFKMGGGFIAVFSLLLGFVLQSLSMTLRSLWLAWWSDGTYSLSNSQYFSGYAGVAMINVVCIVGLSWIVTVVGYYAAKHLHKGAVSGLLKAPMSFFDSQPIGRILNRLSKDIQGVDQTMHMASVNFYFCLSMIVASLVSLAYATPYVLIIFGVLMVFYYFFLLLYRAASRELKRITSIERSPLNAHISESLGGLATLRAYKAEKRVIAQLRHYLDRSNVPLFASMSIRLWLTIRISLFSALIILFVALFGVLSTAFPASLMGLAISTCNDLTLGLWVFVMFTAMYESELVAAERLIEYSSNLPREAAREVPTDPKPTQWPSGGSIEVKGLEVKYASMDEPVIRGMNLSIRPGEKVGLVGRTGSGKSTFLTALFRLVEPHAGTIEIDGEDITKLGLKTLRSRMQIIPQEPVVFAGTIRSTVDPETEHTDAEIWDALEMVGMKEFVAGKEGKLEALVEENGANLSVGQRQLLVLARTLCARPKILVMDEASSAVDAQADALLQASIRNHFGKATVVSIAHRLNTIADFDRVVVLEAGKVIECDSPAALLRIPGGAFRTLVDATGPANAALIQEIAEEREKQMK
ncbi:hypothetical protein HDU96_005230 [Phlyctochytrium bullatum]|nr:hypothetical protein HDU96_005230 [Phlyctochytrium bullatum]